MKYLYILCFSLSATAQSFGLGGGVTGSVSILLGNQNQKIQLSAYGIVTASYNDISLESSINLYAATIFKAHTVKTRGLNYGFDFSTLLGIGDNSNLLGSSFVSNQLPLLFNTQGGGGFSGIGFGFKKDYLPQDLSIFNVRQGKLLFRTSAANHSINISFLNDFKFGRLFYGEGTDFGPTGALQISYSSIRSSNTAYQAGAGIELFTPKPDYSKTPTHPVNSDNGRRNVWYTERPHKDLLYANLYGFGNYTDQNYSVGSKVGLNSQKIGAFVQNTLHDSFGLNPRYPWRVEEKSKILLQISGTGFVNGFVDD